MQSLSQRCEQLVRTSHCLVPFPSILSLAIAMTMLSQCSSSACSRPLALLVLPVAILLDRAPCPAVSAKSSNVSYSVDKSQHVYHFSNQSGRSRLRGKVYEVFTTYRHVRNEKMQVVPKYIDDYKGNMGIETHRYFENRKL